MDITKQVKGWIKWNRKFHIYIGLYFLFFIWLFGLSGVLLNHHWKFANSWENRTEISYDKSIEISNEREQLALLYEIMNKLNLNGSIDNPEFSNDSVFLNFVISKPGIRYIIKANLHDGNIKMTETKFDSWGIMKTLHSMRNPTLKEQGNRYPSLLASIWSISMDIVSVGLIVICLGGWYMWLQVHRQRFYLGLISLTGGFILCIYFLLF